MQFKPIMKEYIWGGSRLMTEFHYPSDSDHVGECWVISAHPRGDCELVEEGCGESDRLGLTLSQIYAAHRDLFGYPEDPTFPLLVKLIDAKENLSIQVHPDDDYAAAHEDGCRGKYESWYILDCPEDAYLILGHHARTREELAEMVAEERYEELFRKVPIHKGDFVTIAPGTIHNTTAGCLILEVQQSSDLTYRLYDYNRLQDGVPRPLHVAKCLDVITVPDEGSETRVVSTRGLTPNVPHELVVCPRYSVYKLIVKDEAKIEQNKPFMIVSVIEGTGVIDGRIVQKGTHILLPYGYGTVHFMGDMEVILSSI
jgi:mannose-6-phosphate isomerase class I